MRLLTRTTRNVSMTEAGERLYVSVAPRLEEIEAEIAAVAEYRDHPAGTIRITASEHVANTVVWPRLAHVLPRYPDLKVELTIDYGLADIVEQRYDIGIRLGERVAQGMIAVPVTGPQRMAIVGSPAYFRTHAAPQRPGDLAAHDCIGLRLPTHGGLMVWDLRRDDQNVNVRVQGQWTFNSSIAMHRAALAGAGLAYLLEDMVLEDIAAGRLQRVMQDWCDVFDGFHAYYPSRRQSSSALRVVIDALRV